jgi:hypothetical protein
MTYFSASSTYLFYSSNCLSATCVDFGLVPNSAYFYFCYMVVAFPDLAVFLSFSLGLVYDTTTACFFSFVFDWASFSGLPFGDFPFS